MFYDYIKSYKIIRILSADNVIFHIAARIDMQSNNAKWRIFLDVVSQNS